VRRVRLRHLLLERDVRGRVNEQVLSVYREYGVVPKDSRDDNFNKTPDNLHTYKLVEAGDLVVNKMKAWQGSVALSEHRGIVSGDYLVCSIKSPGIAPRFLHYLLRSQALIEEYRKRSSGIRPSQWRIYWDDLADIAITLPPIDIQRSVARYLDNETARVDALTIKKRRMIDLIDQRELGLLEHHFSPKSGDTTVRLGRLAIVQTGVTVSASRASLPNDIHVPYLRVANVQHGNLELSEVREISIPVELADRSTLREGDVLMTEGGDIDKLGRGTVWRGQIPQCVHQNHVFAVRVDRTKLIPEFLAHFTRTGHARSYFEATGVQSTNLASTSAAKVADLKVPLVPIDFQQRACEAFEKQRSKLVQARTLLLRQLALLNEHRQALITAAVIGELEIPEAA